ncbi:M20 family metallopeptidase [Clostridium sp. AM58-1XD]|uniref:M20 family metallopeptidase n=1 Tax=Clostridium sp. AM58-1XD TaxID=2292307 RepID=UPI000E49C5BC|nr:M20 family metallopeptidase [Clostridium sp. AM58-1XD]RGY94978.1 M20 family peptidase [Clostridium sp. AM58-1XD]
MEYEGYDTYEVIRLTRELVKIESSNPGVYEGAVGEFVFRWFEALGVSVWKEEVLPGRFNIMAKIQGEIHDPALVYICHMDTVPIGEGWSRAPLDGEIDGGRMYGRGACDMKSGLAAGMMAFKHIAGSGKTLQHDFIFAATVDEEDVMLGAEKVIHSKIVTERSWVLDAEPTEGKIKVAHKGKTWFILTVRGKAAHASIPFTGVDAVAAMSEIAVEIKRKIAECTPHEELGRCSAVFGTITGGTNTNIVPDECTMTIDMRLVPPMNSERSIRLVKEAVAAGLKKVEGAECEIVITAARPPVEKDDKSFLLGKLTETMTEVDGKAPEVDFFPGYTDTAVIAAMTGNKNCMSYGPGDLGVAHKPDEYVPCDEVIHAETVMTKLAEKILY